MQSKKIFYKQPLYSGEYKTIIYKKTEFQVTPKYIFLIWKRLRIQPHISLTLKLFPINRNGYGYLQYQLP